MNTVYYFGAKLAAADLAPAYVNLKNTNFPSLYAATSPDDDFAEAFASYVHVVLMKRLWQITISRDGQVVNVFKPCWGEARCAKNRKSSTSFSCAPPGIASVDVGSPMSEMNKGTARAPTRTTRRT